MHWLLVHGGLVHLIWVYHTQGVHIKTRKAPHLLLLLVGGHAPR